MTQPISDCSLFLLQFIWIITSKINFSEHPSHHTTPLLKNFQSLAGVYCFQWRFGVLCYLFSCKVYGKRNHKRLRCFEVRISWRTYNSFYIARSTLEWGHRDLTGIHKEPQRCWHRYKGRGRVFSALHSPSSRTRHLVPMKIDCWMGTKTSQALKWELQALYPQICYNSRLCNNITIFHA